MYQGIFRKIIVAILFIVASNTFGYSQGYSLTLDTVVKQDTLIYPQLIVEDSLIDSLRYDISVVMSDNDSTVVFRDTFEYHYPKVLKFDFFDLNYASDKYLIRMPSLSSSNFFVRIGVLSAQGILEEELILNL